MKTIALAFLLSAPLCAQLFSVGVKGGMPFNDLVATKGGLSGMSANWTLGPAVELNLPLGLGVEVDALYRRIGYQEGTPYRAGAFRFPVLAKYKFPGSLARVFVVTGFSARALGDLPNLLDQPNKGFVLGGGIRYDLKLVKFSTELRWTRYGEGKYNLTPTSGSLAAARNQAEFLMGFTF